MHLINVTVRLQVPSNMTDLMARDQLRSRLVGDGLGGDLKLDGMMLGPNDDNPASDDNVRRLSDNILLLRQQHDNLLKELPRIVKEVIKAEVEEYDGIFDGPMLALVSKEITEQIDNIDWSAEINEEVIGETILNVLKNALG